MTRSFYSDSVESFIHTNSYTIFGKIVSNDGFSSDDLQKNTWKAEIEILKRELSCMRDGQIIFEYTIPRIGKRVDNILLYQGIVFIIEFKVGDDKYQNYAIEQVLDYALDLKNFHKESHDKFLVPILVATKAKSRDLAITYIQEDILEPICCNESNLGSYIAVIADRYKQSEFSTANWINSLYMPTPTIIEAAQALYRGNNVEDITRNDASAINLSLTTQAINEIIDFSKNNHRKSICFVTGVPGAGKTLAGLNISIERQKIDENEHAVFLSGNGPLVEVLQEALARDDCLRNATKKSDALRKAKEFIQIIHHFRDDAISVETPPIEKVVIFDEAQRAWTEDMLSKFMKQKKGVFQFDMSEPEFLISIMDRHHDWTTIICLVGGGQEINTGEAGLIEWFDSLKKQYIEWDVYVSKRITDSEYSQGQSLQTLLHGMKCKIVDDLHLAVSIRSFRSEKVSSFVKALLDVQLEEAKQLYEGFKEVYPFVVTRDLEAAKRWIKNKAKGSQRYGITASSGAKRLRTHGVWVQSKVDAPTWFLNEKDDVRSSYFLEETATEFDIQGLELDWTIVCWDANFRFNGASFDFLDFKGTKWQTINKAENISYLKNAYRVLLTRARQGCVIYVPKGDPDDKTRLPGFYNGVYDYFREIGLEVV